MDVPLVSFVRVCITAGKDKSHLRGHARSSVYTSFSSSIIPSLASAARLETSCSPTSWTLADLGYQRSEEFLGQAVHHTLDEARPKLRELSTNLGLYFIGQHSAISISLEMDTRTALGEARYPP